MGGAAAEGLGLPSHRSHKSANPTEIERLQDRVHELELATAVRLAGLQMIFLALSSTLCLSVWLVIGVLLAE